MATPVLERVRDWSMRDHQAGRQLNFHIYNGTISLQVRNTKDRSPKPILNRNLSEYHLQFIYRTIEQIMKASPETKLPVKISDMDTAMKPPTPKLSTVLTFEKDGRGVYKIHVSDVMSNQTYSFLIRGNNLIAVGNDPLTDADRSVAMMCVLKDWFQAAKILSHFTYVGSQFQRGGQPGGGGNGGYRGGNGGGNGGGGYGGGQPSGGSDDGDGGGSGLPF